MTHAKLIQKSNNVEAKTLLFSPDSKSSLYLPDSQRFDKDFAKHDKNVRE